MPEDNEKYRERVIVDISTIAVFKLLLFFLVIVFLYFIREVVGIVFASLVFSLALNPWVNWLQAQRMPRILAIFSIYLLILSAFTLALVLIIPPVAQQVADIAAKFPAYYQQVLEAIQDLRLFRDLDLEQQLETGLGRVGELASTAAPGVVSILMTVFGGVFSLILILVLTLYFILEEAGFKRLVRNVAPRRHRAYVSGLVDRMESRMSLWLRGQILLSLSIFVLTFISLEVAGINYALLIAFIAGLFEIIPFLGPILAGIPAVFFALAQSPGKAVLVVVIFVIVQQLENHVLTPKVLGGSVHMNPLVVIVVVLVGAQLGGVLGILLSVPVASALSILLRDILEARDEATTNETPETAPK
ncbi:MAG: AI-2E family transporter [Candidatus Zixiibacteriota bacterium]|nr:MAG: AI-2E family transporter [candidate division Zixibacteria bacterium]